MYVTKHNMANAVASVSKQLENVSDALAVSQDLSRVSWIICVIYANSCSHTFFTDISFVVYKKTFD